MQSNVDGVVTGIELLAQADVRINGGFFVFRRDILDAIEPGEERVVEPFARLIARGELIAFTYDGFGSRWTRSRTSSGSTLSSRVEAALEKLHLAP